MTSRFIAWAITVFGFTVFLEGLLFLWLEYRYWPTHPLN